MKKLLLITFLSSVTGYLTACSDSTGSEIPIADDLNIPFKVALWGDEFYDDAKIKVNMTTRTIDSMNQRDLAFTLFVGDTKNGHSECTDQAIGQDVVDIFNRLSAPTLYSVGDNEWTGCHRTSNGSYDPLERLDFLRSVFFVPRILVLVVLSSSH